MSIIHLDHHYVTNKHYKTKSDCVNIAMHGVLWCAIVFYVVLWCAMVCYVVLWCAMLCYGVL